MDGLHWSMLILSGSQNPSLLKFDSVLGVESVHVAIGIGIDVFVYEC